MTSGARYSAVPQNVLVESVARAGHPARSCGLSLPTPLPPLPPLLPLAIQYGVPGGVANPFAAPFPFPLALLRPPGVDGAASASAPARRGNSFESPKSVSTMCPSAAMRMFSGLRSR